MNHDQTSLIWVHIVGNIGYQSTTADGKADEFCHDWPKKG